MLVRYFICFRSLLLYVYIQNAENNFLFFKLNTDAYVEGHRRAPVHSVVHNHCRVILECILQVPNLPAYEGGIQLQRVAIFFNPNNFKRLVTRAFATVHARVALKLPGTN